MKKSSPGAATAAAGVTEAAARELFGDKDPMDQALPIRKVPFTMMGILERKGQSTMGQGQDDVVMVPPSTARNRLSGNAQGRPRRAGTIQVKVREGVSMKDAEDGIRALLRDFLRLLSCPQSVQIMANTGVAP